MQHEKLIWRPLAGLRSLGFNPGTNAAAASADQSRLAIWWKRTVTATSVGYVVFSQTLHAQPGWSRLGVVFAALLAGLLVLGRVLRLTQFGSCKWAWVSVPFLVYCLIKSVPEPGNEWPVEELFPLICAFMGGLGVAFALQTGVSFRTIVYAQVLSNLINIIAALLGIGAESIGGDPVRYAGVTGNANDFGLQLTLGACLIWLVPSKAGWFPCLFAFFGVAYAIGTSGSRTALMVTPFFLGLVVIQMLAYVRKHRVLIALCSMAAACLLGVIVAPALLDRAKDITAIDRALDHHDSSFEKRMGMIQQAIRLWREAPVFGHGLNGFERLGGYGGYAHNNYAELLCNTGLLGVMLYYALHISIVVRGIYRPARMMFYTWICVLMLLVIDIGSVNYKTKQTILMLMVLLSLPIATKASGAATAAFTGWKRRKGCLPGDEPRGGRALRNLISVENQKFVDEEQRRA